jgi:hypothetical protein
MLNKKAIQKDIALLNDSLIEGRGPIDRYPNAIHQLVQVKSRVPPAPTILKKRKNKRIQQQNQQYYTDHVV